MAATILTQQHLKTILHYDPVTGVFTWNIRPKQYISIGSIAGYTRPDGYVDIKINNSNYKAHRLAWLYVHGNWPTCRIDHIDGNQSNNRIANLRDASSSENAQNRKRKSVDNKSGYLGVSRKYNKWQALICIKGNRFYLGAYETPELAHYAYVDAKRRLHPFGTI
jgi:hypothetical protein